MNASATRSTIISTGNTYRIYDSSVVTHDGLSTLR